MTYLSLNRAMELLGVGKGAVKRGVIQGELPVAGWAEHAGGGLRPLVTREGLEELRQRLLVRWAGLPAFALALRELEARGPIPLDDSAAAAGQKLAGRARNLSRARRIQGIEAA